MYNINDANVKQEIAFKVALIESGLEGTEFAESKEQILKNLLDKYLSCDLLKVIDQILCDGHALPNRIVKKTWYTLLESQIKRTNKNVVIIKPGPLESALHYSSSLCAQYALHLAKIHFKKYRDSYPTHKYAYYIVNSVTDIPQQIVKSCSKPKGYTYLIEANGHRKFGRTGNFDQRMKAYPTSRSEYARIAVPDEVICEKYISNSFKKSFGEPAEGREWFDANYIQSLRAYCQGIIDYIDGEKLICSRTENE